MHCELVVPGLFHAASGLRLEAAELLVARGRHTGGDAKTLEAWLAEAFGLGGTALPAGALTELAQGGHAEGHWARADPVHLRLLRDRITVVPAEAFPLSRQEADILCAAINAHFAGRMEAFAAEPARWTVRFSEAPALDAGAPPVEMAGRDLAPRGRTDALANEIQMVLHEHPVNEAREARGEPAVNGLWLWGTGAVPAGLQAPWQSVSADEPSILGLARAAGVRGRSLPASADMLLERAPEEGRHLVVLDTLRAPLALGDLEVGAKRARDLEEAWFAPLLAALRSERIGMLTLHVPDAGRSAEAIRGDLRRFWRRPRPLATMAP